MSKPSSRSSSHSKENQRQDEFQDALLEIGSEEIPASYIPPALAFMKSFAENGLRQKRLPFQSVVVLGTPRRLALLISGLASRSEAQTEDVLGPSLKAAKTETGEWTQAARGFAQSRGLGPDALQIKNTPKGDYVGLTLKHEGIRSETLLKEIFAEMIAAIPFPKKMIWNESRFKFARPIRNLLCLYGARVLPLSAAGIKASNKTFGLFHESSALIAVHAPRQYVTVLKNHCVLADPEARKKTILHSAEQLVARMKGRLKEDDALLEEIAWIVEHPVAVLGSFDPSFLSLPAEVLTTCMKKHQKYFSILDAKGGLMPCFIAVRNGISEHQDIVRKGYEKVLTARLTDAQFFFQEDLKKPLDAYVQKSRAITLQKKLGTLGEKTDRMQKIARFAADALRGSGPAAFDLPTVERAVHLSKFDLTTSMVYEFPELQGIVGDLYARKYGEPAPVAAAIREHYHPVTNQGALPASQESRLISLCDRIDGLTGHFWIGLTPSGNADPYGLRRQATGILRIVLESGWRLPLKDLVGFTLAQFETQGGAEKNAAGAARDVLNFLTERLQLLLQDQGFELDEIQAVTRNAQDPDSQSLNAVLLKEKIAALRSVRSHPDFDAIATAFKRVSNILKQARGKNIPCSREDFQAALLKDPAESDLRAAVEDLGRETGILLNEGKYEQALTKWVAIRRALDAFFEKVMVMDPDPALAKNRLSLLFIMESDFRKIADFSLLQNRTAAPAAP